MLNTEPGVRAPEGGRVVRKPPNNIDVHVGSRVRLRRMMIGMSQEKLGEKLGLTFQQVQKYEKGTNRIGASRLHRMAEILDVPVQFFFEDAPGQHGGAESAGLSESEPAPYVLDFVSSTEGLQLNRAFTRITSPAVRRKVLELIKALADAGQEAEAE